LSTPTTPIAVFVYNRPAVTQKTLDQLRSDPQFNRHPVYVFCDGAKSSSDLAAVEQTRTIARKCLSGFSPTIIQNGDNEGLAASVSKGVTRLVSQYGQIIVVEDDLLLSHGTLDYFDYSLCKYRGVERVMQISAHAYLPRSKPLHSTSYFMPMTTSWGWATWSRAWSHFDSTARMAESVLKTKETRHRFDMEGSLGYSNMLQQQLAYELDSWAVFWRLAMHCAGGLTLFPGKSLVRNEGFGEDATHTKRAAAWMVNPEWSTAHSIKQYPDLCESDAEMWLKTTAYLRKYNYPNVPRRLFLRILSLSRRIMK